MSYVQHIQYPCDYDTIRYPLPYFRLVRNSFFLISSLIWSIEQDIAWPSDWLQLILYLCNCISLKFSLWVSCFHNYLVTSHNFQVYKRLELTLELVKKELEITKIQVCPASFNGHYVIIFIVELTMRSLLFFWHYL